MQWILGADPGKHGAVVLINAEKSSGEYTSEDVVCIPTKVDAERAIDVAYLYNKLKPYAKDVVYCMQEHVHAIFGSSANGSFEFGDANGALRASLELICLSEGNPLKVNLVPPKVWQRTAWYGIDVVANPKLDKSGKPVILKSGKPKMDVDTKKTSSNAAHVIFPGVSFVMPRCRNEHDGCVDAALIAYYGSIIRFRQSTDSESCRFRL